MNFGLPYTGSKNRICKWVLEYIPDNQDCFVDVFAGGCAITHAVYYYGKAKRIIANDFNQSVIALFKGAIEGKYKDRTEWVSREDFFKLKESDPFIKFVWSFGNKGTSYIYGKHIEEYKHALHLVVVNDEWNLLLQLCPEVYDSCKQALDGIKDIHTRRLTLQTTICNRLKELSGNDWNADVIQSNPLFKSVKHKKSKLTSFANAAQSLERVERLESLLLQHNNNIERVQGLEGLSRVQFLERMERMEQLQWLEGLNGLCFTSKDYRELEIPEGAFMYCDPPYIGSDVDYQSDFDHAAFYDWCVEKSKTHPLLISEFRIDDPRFVCIGEKESLNCMTSSIGSRIKIEKLFKVKYGLEWNYPPTSIRRLPL